MLVKETSEDRAEREEGKRYQHRPRALVRMIATGAGRDVARARIADVRLLAGRLIVRVIVRVAVEGALDMLRRGPERLAAAGEEDEPPAVYAREPRPEPADEKSDHPQRGAAERKRA